MHIRTLASDQGGVDATRRGSRGNVPLANRRLRLLANNGSGLRSGLLLLLLLDLLGVAVEEHVDHYVPAVGSARDGATEAEDLTGKEPPGKTDRVAGLVVDGDRDVDELEGSIGVAECDHGDVDVGRLTDGLVVDAGVGNNDETGLLERAGDVVGEATGRETASNRLRASVCGELEDRTVAVRAGGDDTDIIRVLNGGDDASGENELLPGLADVDDVDA